MEKRNIKIDINIARDWYYGGNNTMKELALQVFTEEEILKKELPKSWLEFQMSINSRPIHTYEKEVDILERLFILRDVYRQGWKPDWVNGFENKYCICIDYTLLVIRISYMRNFLFAFPTQELAEQFLDNFKDELEQLKELL